jgi:hypothetical protein
MRVVVGLGLAAAVVIGLAGAASLQAQTSEVERGKYLVVLAGCTDCYTPGYFFGKPDQAR